MNRVLYCWGRHPVDGCEVPLRSAWHGAGACTAVAGPAGDRAALQWWARAPACGTPLPTISGWSAGRVPDACAPVEFDLGAEEALPHRHKGGGIRCTSVAPWRLRIKARRTRDQAGEAWLRAAASRYAKG